MIDHGGVIDEETRCTNLPALKIQLLQFYSSEVVDATIDKQKLRETDFRLPVKKVNAFDQGMENIPVMPNGAETIRLLNELVEEYDARLVFHSKNVAADQISLLQQLDAAIRDHNTKNKDILIMPKFEAMVDANKCYKGVAPAEPKYEVSDYKGIRLIQYDAATEDEGKSSVRQAISTFCEIPEEDRGNHFVLDDGGSNIRKAKAEGYQAFRISDKMSTLSALQQIRSILLKKRLGQDATTLSEGHIDDFYAASVSAVDAKEGGLPVPGMDEIGKQDEDASHSPGVLKNTPRKKKTSHRNQVIAGIIPTVVSAAVSTCLFALIPHLGMIAILPAVLVLVVGIAISIAVPLAMKHAHMQQQSALLKNANADGDTNQDQTVDQSPPPSLS